MNELLLSEIKSEKNELLQTFLLVEEYIFCLLYTSDAADE